MMKQTVEKLNKSKFKLGASVASGDGVVITSKGGAVESKIYYSYYSVVRLCMCPYVQKGHLELFDPSQKSCFLCICEL